MVAAASVPLRRMSANCACKMSMAALASAMVGSVAGNLDTLVRAALIASSSASVALVMAGPTRVAITGSPPPPQVTRSVAVLWRRSAPLPDAAVTV